MTKDEYRKIVLSRDTHWPCKIQKRMVNWGLTMVCNQICIISPLLAHHHQASQSLILEEGRGTVGAPTERE